MEPRRDDGDDLTSADVATALVVNASHVPQWSPVVTTGTTTNTSPLPAALPGRNGAPS